jgi:hypothetical protein
MIRDQLTPDSDSNDADAPSWDLNINYIPVTYDAGYPPAVIQMKPNTSQVSASLFHPLACKALCSACLGNLPWLIGTITCTCVLTFTWSQSL